MGQPKLLLPWPSSMRRQNQPIADQRDAHGQLAENSVTLRPPFYCVIDRVLEAWTKSGVIETIVVVRGEDHALIDACRSWPVTIVHPTAPTQDMKGSVCVGLQHIASAAKPIDGARCFIAPADLPGLKAQVIDGLIAAQTDVRTILMPRFGNTLESSIAGHPALLPWEWTDQIFSLGPQEGIDVLIKQLPQELVLFPPDWAVTDIDTLSDYQAACQRAKT